MLIECDIFGFNFFRFGFCHTPSHKKKCKRDFESEIILKRNGNRLCLKYNTNKCVFFINYTYNNLILTPCDISVENVDEI